MKNSSIVCLASLIPILGFLQVVNAQDDLGNRLSQRQSSCQDISLNSSEFIPWYYQEGIMDSALIVLTYWGEKCGNTEPVMRANIILSLEMHYFEEAMLDDNILRFMDSYNTRMSLIRENKTYLYNYYQSTFDYVPVGGSLDTWSMDMAAALKDEYEPGTLEYLLCLFYSGQTDSVYRIITSPPYSETMPGRLYNAELEEIMKLPSVSISGYAGTWMPTGSLTGMGIHPEIGMTYGIKVSENLYEFALGVKFIKTPDYYLARRSKNSPQELTRDFTGAYIALEYSRDLFKNQRFTPFFSAGAGFDTFTMFPADTDKDEQGISANSYNFSIGGGYRLPVAKRSFLSIQARYNMVDYTLNKLFDTRGHVVSLRVSYGIFQNLYRENRLRDLNYVNPTGR